MGRLDGRVAIITGAAQGIGAAYAKALAGELVEQSWSGGTFTLRYTAEPGGISEIVVPSRLAEDPALQGSGACARRSGDALYLKAEAGDVELRIEL